MADYLDQLLARGVISDDAAASAQEARDAAAYRMRQAVQPDEGRQEGAATAYLDQMGQRLRDQLGDMATDTVQHPEHLIGPGGIGAVRSGAAVTLFRELLRSGTPIEEAAQRAGITAGAARALVKGSGVPANGMIGVFDVPAAAERFKALASEGKLAGEIAREFGVSAPTVRTKAKQLGIELRRAPTPAQIRRESAGYEEE